MDLSNFVYWEKIDRNFLLMLTQSNPDSQTVPSQARNTASGCNAVPSHGRRTGFQITSKRYRDRLKWFEFK